MLVKDRMRVYDDVADKLDEKNGMLLDRDREVQFLKAEIDALREKLKQNRDNDLNQGRKLETANIKLAALANDLQRMLDDNKRLKVES